VVSCSAGRVEVAVSARRGVGTEGGYFFIHRQSMMDEARSFEWQGVASGDEVVIFDGSVTRGPAYWPGKKNRHTTDKTPMLLLNQSDCSVSCCY
jgi:hypothetical protein